MKKVREAQKLAGEVLWLTSRTRPDLCYTIQKMKSAATKDPELAIKFGFRMFRYLKGTDQHGLKYHNLEATKKKFQEFKEDWPDEAFDEMKICVWSDSSFASQVQQKSQGALVVTQAGGPVFWKCGRRALLQRQQQKVNCKCLLKEV